MKYLTVLNGKDYPIKDSFKGFEHCALVLDSRGHEQLILEIQDNSGRILRYEKTSAALDCISSVHISI